MRILIYGINFAPELTGIGKFTGEMAEYLSAAGHAIRMVTTPPYYPHWQVGAGYSAWQYRCETWQGIRVCRCPLWVPRRPTGFTRVLHLTSFALSSLPALLMQVPWRPDVVLSIAPAIVGAPGALLAARLSRARAWLHIQDFELDAALKLDILPKLGLLSGWATALERRLYSSFDRITTISEAMLSHLHTKGISPQRTGLLPNWVDTLIIFPSDQPSTFRQSWKIPAESCLVLYAGNMGRKQGLETLLDAARLVVDDPSICFWLIGEGAARSDLEALAADLPNVHFAPLVPFDQLNELLNAADLHVLPQRPGAANLVMPSKLTGMLASGRPVIATGTPDTELGRIIAETGLLVPPGDPQGLAAAIRRLANDPALRQSSGQRSRRYAEEHLDRRLILEKLNNELSTLV